MPASSCSAIPASCAEEYQPGSGADIELCVAASTTSGSERPHSSACPLHAPERGAAVETPPPPANTATAIATSMTAATAGTKRRRGRRPPAMRAAASGS
jgi:hypothetical protein